MRGTFRGCQPGGHLFVLMTVYLVVILLEMVESDHTTLCINLPHLRYRDDTLTSLGMEKFPQSEKLWRRFQEKIIAGIVDTNDATGRFRTILPGMTYYPRGGLRIYKIKNTQTQRYLNGWFRVEFWMEANSRRFDLHEVLKAFILHVEDDVYRRQSIGEFSFNFPTELNQCPENDATKYMLISCGGASRAEPLVSNTIVLIRNNSKADEPTGTVFPPESDGLQIVPNLKGKHSLNFYIRIPVQDCNQHLHYVFRASVIIDRDIFDGNDGMTPAQYKEDLYRVTTTYLWIEDGYIPGASDALPSRSHSKYLDCSERLSVAPDNMPWYFVSRNGIYENVDGRLPYIIGYIHGCQGQFFRGRCFHNAYTLAGAYGRDTKQIVKQNVAEENQIPLCESEQEHPTGQSGVGEPGLIPDHHGKYYRKPMKYNNKDAKFLTTHEYLYQFATSCNTTFNGDPNCNISKVVIDVKRRRLLEIKGRSIHLQRRRLRLLGFNEYSPYYYTCAIEDTNRTKYSGNNCTAVRDNIGGIGFHTHGFHRLLWGMRKGHALLMAIAFLFVLPVNLFITRYFKESFMSQRVLYTRIWYQVHVHGTFLLAVLLIAGLGIVYLAEFYLGSSLTGWAVSHRTVGWISFALFIIMTVLGGFRCYEDPLRKVTIGLHWGFGILIYILMGIEMLTGVLIPGNGVASNDPSLCDYDRITNSCGEQKSTWTSGAFIHILAWLFVELVMHIIMMFFIMVSDKQMVIEGRRIFFPVLIPVIKEKSKTNAFGQSIRVILLCVYMFLALCSTSMYIIAYIIHTHSTLKGLGPMESTHFQNDSGDFIILDRLADF